MYTLKKHVRKPRKAPPGLAVCSHEKTVFVEPADEAMLEAMQARARQQEDAETTQPD